MALRVAHDCAPQRGHGSERDEDRPQLFRVRAERTGEDRPIQPRDGVHTELGHHAGEQDAHGRGRHGVGVGKPEVNRHRGGLGQKAEEQQHHRHHRERVRTMTVERGADLGHVERPGPGVEQRDPDEDRVGADAVGDREVDRALDRCPLLDLVAVSA